MADLKRMSSRIRTYITLDTLEFLLRVTPHRAIAVVISDFIGSPAVSGKRSRKLRPQMMLREQLSYVPYPIVSG